METGEPRYEAAMQEAEERFNEAQHDLKRYLNDKYNGNFSLDDSEKDNH